MFAKADVKGSRGAFRSLPQALCTRPTLTFPFTGRENRQRVPELPPAPWAAVSGKVG